LNDLFFIGGVHGVGKGTICHEISNRTNLVHISASDILKWEEVSERENKKVANIQDTQDRLTAGLGEILEKSKSYLIDGHFCLLNSKGSVEKIPIKTFEKISPKLIAVATTGIDVIKNRLKKRDGEIYSHDLLKDMQMLEVLHAKEVSRALKIPFIEVKDGNYVKLIKLINNLN